MLWLVDRSGIGPERGPAKCALDYQDPAQLRGPGGATPRPPGYPVGSPVWTRGREASSRNA